MPAGCFPGSLPPAEWEHLASTDCTVDVRPAVEGRGGRCAESECEHCHLDDVEETRFARPTQYRVPKPERRALVITASRDMGRTASTWVFNAVRLLFRQAGEACDAYWVRQLSREKLFERLAGRNAHVLVKTHEWAAGETHMPISPERFEAIRPLFTHVVCSVREGFPPDPNWMRVATHVTNFEEIVVSDGSGALRVLRGLAEHLGLDGLTDHDLRWVDYRLMTLEIPAHGDVRVSKMWSFHRRRGGRAPPQRPPEPEFAWRSAEFDSAGRQDSPSDCTDEPGPR